MRRYPISYPLIMLLAGGALAWWVGPMSAWRSLVAVVLLMVALWAAWTAGAAGKKWKWW
jgi:hypothetical protein